MASANWPCGLSLLIINFYCNVVGEKRCTLAPWFLGWKVEGNSAWENFSTSFWWYKCKFRGAGVEYHSVSQYQERRFLPAWRKEQKRPEERTGRKRKEELWRAWSSLLTKITTLECPKTAKMDIIPVPVFHFVFCNILWKKARTNFLANPIIENSLVSV